MLVIHTITMLWEHSTAVGILCVFNHRGRNLKPGTKPVYDVAIDNFEQLFGAVKVLLTFQIINSSLMSMTRKPVLELGINNGLMMAAERLLESNMSIDKVVILLRLDKQQEKFFA